MPVVEVVHLTKRYGAARGVDDVTIEVEPGEIFGFLGPNGAGKSTTIRTMLDFQRPTDGAIRIFGLDSTRDSVAIHRRTGYLPGDLQLFPKLTGREHVDAFLKIRRQHDGATSARLGELVDRFEAELDRPVRELSKGNKQKIGLLLTFVHGPELLVLDEPTSGLDPLMQEQFHHLVRDTAAEGRTVFLSSHSLDEVQRLATTVSVIREGKLVVTDTIANLQHQAPQRVTFEFAAPVDASEFAALAGVKSAIASGNTVELAVTGSLDAVVKHAATHETISVSARPADLEDLFLSYYEGAEAGDG